MNHLLPQSCLLYQRIDFFPLFLIVPCTGAESFECSREQSDAQTIGNFFSLCGGLGEEIEDGWFDAFVPREIALEPEEDDVEDESEKKSCDKMFHNSGSNSSHCSMT